jgi:hypothetical protein
MFIEKRQIWILAARKISVVLKQQREVLVSWCSRQPQDSPKHSLGHSVKNAVSSYSEAGACNVVLLHYFVYFKGLS